MKYAVVVAVVLIILAVAIPSLLRSRVQWPEHPAIGDIRSMFSAQSAYAGANGGFYDRPQCLVEPRSCLPSYPADGPAFLEPALASLTTRHGYTWQFRLGPKAEPEAIARAKASATSAVSFAYVGSPVSPQDGVRTFCGDSSGRVCWMAAGTMPAITDGLCPQTCTALQ